MRLNCLATEYASCMEEEREKEEEEEEEGPEFINDCFIFNSNWKSN